MYLQTFVIDRLNLVKVQYSKNDFFGVFSLEMTFLYREDLTIKVVIEFLSALCIFWPENDIFSKNSINYNYN